MAEALLQLLISLANDVSYFSIFKNQLISLGPTERDLVVVISCSGESNNILSLVHYCNEHDISSLALTSVKGQLKLYSTFTVLVPIAPIEQQEDIHLSICHYIITQLKEGKK
jgi:phosphoheptose isomerase